MPHCLPATVLVAIAFGSASAVSHAAPVTSAGTYLSPHVSVGEHLTHVFSRAISIKGDGFHEYVKRVSGTGNVTVKSVSPQNITFRARYRYDGVQAAAGTTKVAVDGVTHCWNGHCSVNHETSGAVFNRLLWGHAPRELHAGTTWTATIDQPWELGPPGTETVRVARLDPASHTITLVREGHGTGDSLHDRHVTHITITTNKGRALKVSIKPGATHWIGRTIVRDGIIVSDTIMVERQVTLVATTGRTFAGKERAYTLDNLLRDRT